MDIVTSEWWVAAGDAASTFEPLSSQGVFKALRSGIFAAYAAINWYKKNNTGLKRYEWFIREEYADYLTKRQDYYAMEMRWPNASFCHVDNQIHNKHNIKRNLRRESLDD